LTWFAWPIASDAEPDCQPVAASHDLVGRARRRHRGVGDLRDSQGDPRHARGTNGRRSGADIRRALAHLGRAPFFRYFLTTEGAEETIEELVVAATQLSGLHIGAIIVIERQIGLRNYIETGLPLDALLTYDLLVSIFQPKSPLHDGAVMVQNDRIAAAACFLPLTINPLLARSLGTRHRAAIGLTEENDAVAIIVSEETGRISVALDGQLEGPFDPATLKARLKALITRRD
jgi:diadenylate cyclase